MSRSVNRLQQWYMMNCNGDWEHSYGMKIETLDNPGWLLSIDLTDTALESVEIPFINNQTTDDDWYVIKIENNQFIGSCDPTKFEFIIDYFLDEIIAKHARQGLSYEVYERVTMSGINYYRQLLAKMQVDNVFIIESMPELRYSDLKVVDLNDLVASNTSEILQSPSKYKVGDEVRCHLVRMFDNPCIVIND